MTAEAKLPVVATALKSFDDGFRAIGAMPLVAGIALACLMAMSVVSFFAVMSVLPPVGSPRFAAALLSLPVKTIIAVLGIVQSFLIAPAAIAVHRWVLLRQVTHGYPINPSNERYLRFVGFTALVGLLWNVPSVVDAVVALAFDNDETANRVMVLIDMAAYIVILIVVLRRVVLFPAVAVDAPHADWRSARLTVAGHSWRVFFTFLCVTVPLVLLVVPLHYLNLWASMMSWTGQIIFWLGSSIVQLIFLYVFAATASLIYRALDPALGQPASPVPTMPR